MADTIQRVEYFYAQVPNKAGEGARFLTALHEAGINLLAFSGFPEGRGSQLDFVPADPAAFKQFARAAKWKLTGPKLDGGPRSATIVAETPGRLLVISRRNFSMLLKEVPGLTQSLLVTLSRRVRQAEESAERMGGALAGL